MERKQSFNARLDENVIITMLALSIAAIIILAFRFKNSEPCVPLLIRASKVYGHPGDLIRFETGVRSLKSWQWDFGDNKKGVSGKAVADHIYDEEGDYTVSLLANNKCQEFIEVHITKAPVIIKPWLQPKLIGPATAEVGKPVSFIDSTPGVNKREWNFGEDGATADTSKAPSYIYTTPGPKIVSLLLNNDVNQFTTHEIFVNAAPEKTPATNSTAEYSAKRRRQQEMANGPLTDPIEDQINPPTVIEPAPVQIMGVEISREELAAELRGVANNQPLYTLEYFYKYTCNAPNIAVNLNGKTTTFEDVYSRLAKLKPSDKIKYLTVTNIFRDTKTKCIQTLAIECYLKRDILGKSHYNTSIIINNQLTLMSFSTTDISVSAELKKAISIAQAIAKENLSSTFAPPHLLKALLHKDVGLQNLLLKINADVYYLEEWAEVRIETLPKSNAPKETVPAHADVHTSMEEADSVRLALNKNEIEPLHLLIALSTPGVGFSFDQLKTYPLRRDFLMSHAAETAGLNDLLQTNGPKNGQANGTATTLPGEKTGQALLKYCTEKTLLARQGKLDPITGREQETRMMAEILSRRSKPNVMITGEPGVGKSALVDGFALAVVAGRVPQFLLNAKVFELDNGALIAGASYKGEIEDRLKSIIKEIKQHDKAVLFIDEIHTLLDKQGAVAGAANLLKPELSRGAITLIGATTPDEYRKHIEPDEAFARRFELLQVAEPDTVTAFRMMKIVMPYYVAHHSIELPDDTLHEAIRLAARFMKDRRLPDAAIDLADRSMAALRLAIDTGAQTIADHQKELEERMAAGEITLEDLRWHYLQLKNKLSPILWSEITTEEDPLKFAEGPQLQAYLQGAYGRLEKLLPIERKTLEKHDIASIVADKTGIPVGKLQAQETERLLNMPNTLKQRVVGQDYAIASISEAILESRSGLAKAGQPIGSFFFLGPTGTGKTELAKALAEQMFQNENFMIRFDMSEFKEEHSAALLYGAPPGYVGYEEGGLLINKIRQQPYAVVLFDEIEKAHHSVFDIFLQIMDEGKLHDKLGKTGDFSNAIVIFTSNIGSQYVTDSFSKGITPSSTELLEIMGKHFRPEFLGRLTEIVPFSPMKLEMVENILNIQLTGLYSLLQKQGITLTISPEAKTVLAKMGFTPQYGARPLAGVIRSQIRRPLSKKIISKELEAGKNIRLAVDENGELKWE